MKVIFLGGLFPDEIKHEIESNSIGVIQNAANVFQWNLVSGLSNLCQLTLVNLIFIGSYPLRYNKLFVRNSPINYPKNIRGYNVGFSNFMVFKFISRYFQAKKKLKVEVNYDTQAIIIYSVHTPFIKAALDIKNKYCNVSICLIVPDLPIYMSQNKSYTYTFLKRIENNYLNKLIKKVDSFVVLTDSMVDYLNIGNRKWIRIEGIYDDFNLSLPHIQKEKNKTILYTGTLDAAYGIIHLLKAFSHLSNQNYRLWICGEGNAKREVIQYISNDNRVTYFGQLTRVRVLELQRRATVLVNPRLPSEEFTKYSFPSKIIEYLSSGTPSVMYKLKGIPFEYYSYFISPEDEACVSLANTLFKICELDHETLNEIGTRAQKFIIQNKNRDVQCKKILNMLN